MSKHHHVLTPEEALEYYYSLPDDVDSGSEMDEAEDESPEAIFSKTQRGEYDSDVESVKSNLEILGNYSQFLIYSHTLLIKFQILETISYR